MSPDSQVSLREITFETVRAVTRLSVADSQKGFVAPNAVSLAQALFSPQAWYRAIYREDELVGFVMLEDESLGSAPPEKPAIGVWRFMVDERFQGQGIGRAALRLVIEHVRRKGIFSTLQLSYVPGPGCPEPFYLGLGFRHTGRLDGNEVVLELPLAQDADQALHRPAVTNTLPPITLYGAQASGSIAVEAALTLLGIPYTLVEGATWVEESARERVAAQNPMRQIPTLVFPGGEVVTESAAILIHLAEAHPEAQLAPAASDPVRRQFLRWMVYVSSAIYSLHWIKPDVQRIGAPVESRDAVVSAVHDRIAFCWSNMDRQLQPQRYLLGDQLTVLDLYVTVVSRFGPWRTRFYEVAPTLAPVVRRVDQDPRLAEFWARRFPFDDGWE